MQSRRATLRLASVACMIAARPAHAGVQEAGAAAQELITLLIAAVVIAAFLVVSVTVAVRRRRPGAGHSPVTPRAPVVEPSGPRASLADDSEARAMLVAAQDHHFNKRFDAALAIYTTIVERHGDTRQGAIARQQLENLRRV